MKAIKIIVLIIVFGISITNIISNSKIAKINNIKEKNENIIIKDELTISENFNINVESKKEEKYNNSVETKNINEKIEDTSENKEKKRYNGRTSINNKTNTKQIEQQKDNNELMTQQIENNNTKENLETILAPMKNEDIRNMQEPSEYNRKVELRDRIDKETKINLED